MSAGPNFQLLVTSNTGVPLEQVPLAEGVPAWPGSEHQLTELPPHLCGGTLLRCPREALVAGTVVTLTAIGLDARIYVAAEVARAGDAPARGGGLVSALASTPGWLGEVSAPSWCGEASTLAMFSMLAMQDKSVVLPRLSEASAVMLIAAVPVFTGSFAAGLTCSTKANYDRMVVVEEGVIAWRDRDHRYVSIPSYLIGGLLFQGPYKDVPEGTSLTVRPNARARVYVIVERSTNGGLQQALTAAGWAQEAGAPRWHDMQTMSTFSHDCGAGTALSLPATRGSVATFSLIVVELAGAPVAPMEVSCGCGRPAGMVSPAAPLELVPLAEGSAAWFDEPAAPRLAKVPEWMLGATLARGPHQGPPAGAVLAVRPAAPSVVYALVEESLGGKTGRSGGLLPSVLPGSGWEPRQEAPELEEGSKLSVFARRVAAREVLCLPTIAEEGAVLALAAKVDVEAFDASAETNLGLELDKGPMAETAMAWSDRQNRWAWVPTYMNGGILFRGPHDSLPGGTTLRVTASGAFRAYVIVEADYKGGTARTGGLPESLPRAGWRSESSAPSWGDTASTMRVFSKKAPEGGELLLPPLSGRAVFSVVAVSIAASPDRLAEELKRSFRSWDPEGQGGIRKEDLGSLLRVLCPGLATETRDELLVWADKNSNGIIGYEEFIDRVVLASPAA